MGMVVVVVYVPSAIGEVTLVTTGTAVSMTSGANNDVPSPSAVPFTAVITLLAFPAASADRTVTFAAPSIYVLPVAATTV